MFERNLIQFIVPHYIEDVHHRTQRHGFWEGCARAETTHDGLSIDVIIHIIITVYRHGVSHPCIADSLKLTFAYPFERLLLFGEIRLVIGIEDELGTVVLFGIAGKLRA